MREAKAFDIPKAEIGRAWKQVKANHGTFGIDCETIAMFEQKLEKNLYKLWNRMSSGSYQPPAVKGVEIPKGNGKVRLLGIPTVADRIAQTVARNALEPQIEPHFHPDSYAYRPGKSQAQAIAVVRQRNWQHAWVLEYDLKGAFDRIDHELMLKAVRHHTSCRWLLLYIERWLKAPMLKDGQERQRTAGTPQGGAISPLLFNLYLHYTLDRWLQKHYPDVKFVRFADDGILHCDSESQAEQMQAALASRLKECGMELHPEKTKIVYCGTDPANGDYPNQQYDFLNFTFRKRGAKSKYGRYFTTFSPAISNTSAKRLRTEMRAWHLRRKTNVALEDIAKEINPILRGWMNYFCIFNATITKRVLEQVNVHLSRWAKRKYRRFRYNYSGAKAWVDRIKSSTPTLFAHWIK